MTLRSERLACADHAAGFANLKSKIRDDHKEREVVGCRDAPIET